LELLSNFKAGLNPSGNLALARGVECGALAIAVVDGGNIAQAILAQLLSCFEFSAGSVPEGNGCIAIGINAQGRVAPAAIAGKGNAGEIDALSLGGQAPRRAMRVRISSTWPVEVHEGRFIAKFSSPLLYAVQNPARGNGGKWENA
jgi:hypothetical protein